MSNLLKEAIVDAQALKEAALKNAEAAIIDKYSDEVKQTIENLLEQDELGAVQDTFAPDMGADMGMDPGMDVDPEAPVEEVTEDHIPLAATDNLADHEGKNLEETPEEEEEIEFNVNLGHSGFRSRRGGRSRRTNTWCERRRDGHSPRRRRPRCAHHRRCGCPRRSRRRRYGTTNR